MICSCRRRILLTHFKLWESASHSYSTRPRTGRTRQELIQILDDICSSSRSEHPVLPPQPTFYNHNRNSQKTPHELLEDYWEASERHVKEQKSSGKPKARIDREKVGMFGQHGWVREQNERESKAKGKERARNWVLEAHEAASLARNKEFVFNSAKEDEEDDHDEDSGDDSVHPSMPFFSSLAKSANSRSQSTAQLPTRARHSQESMARDNIPSEPNNSTSFQESLDAPLSKLEEESKASNDHEPSERRR